MSNRLRGLKEQGKITDEEYNNYILFAGNDVGIRYLKQKLDAIVMEEPVIPKTVLFVWHDGRRSIWRDIKLMINRVEDLLKKGIADDRFSSE